MDSGLFGNGDLDDPKTQALLGTFLKMLEASGPSPVRRTFGSILGTAGQEGLKQYDQAKLIRNRDEETRRRNSLVDMQIKKMQDALRQESILEEAAKAAYQSPIGEANQTAFNQTGLPLGRVENAAPQAEAMKTATGGINPESWLREAMSRGANPIQAIAAAQGLKKVDAPLVAGNVVLSSDGRRILYAPQEKPTDEWEELPGVTPGGQMLQRNKRTGEIKAVGSGPPQPNNVVIQQAAQGEAKGRVSENVLRLRDAYEELEAAGGAISPKQTPVENAANLAMNTPPGQYVGRALGTKAQTARDKIASLRPALISEIRQATGMSARSMDSNVELQFYLKMATDTGVDPEVNFAALEYIDKNYGNKGQPLGIGITGTPSGKQKLNSLKGTINPIAPQGGLTRGQVVNGYTYLGGNPNDPNSWAKTP